jgi:effector-binding domain-containing protein
MTDTIGTRPATVPEIVELAERPAAVVRVDAALAELPRVLGEAFGLVARTIADSGATIAGHPFVRYLSFGERIDAEVGFPFAGTLVPTDRVAQTMLPGGRAVTTTHVGPYDEIATAWERTVAWMGEQQLECAGSAWEAYLTGPDDPGPPVTEIYWPIR